MSIISRLALRGMINLITGSLTGRPSLRQHCQRALIYNKFMRRRRPDGLMNDRQSWLKLGAVAATLDRNYSFATTNPY